MNTELDIDFPLSPGETTIEKIEGFEITVHLTDLGPRVRIYDAEPPQYLRDVFSQGKWIWGSRSIPEPVKQFAENYARLIS